MAVSSHGCKKSSLFHPLLNSLSYFAAFDVLFLYGFQLCILFANLFFHSVLFSQHDRSSYAGLLMKVLHFFFSMKNLKALSWMRACFAFY